MPETCVAALYNISKNILHVVRTEIYGYSL